MFFLRGEGGLLITKTNISEGLIDWLINDYFAGDEDVTVNLEQDQSHTFPEKVGAPPPSLINLL